MLRCTVRAGEVRDSWAGNACHAQHELKGPTAAEQSPVKAVCLGAQVVRLVYQVLDPLASRQHLRSRSPLYLGRACPAIVKQPSDLLDAPARKLSDGP